MGNLTCLSRTDVSLPSVADQTDLIVNRNEGSLLPFEGIIINEFTNHMHRVDKKKDMK